MKYIKINLGSQLPIITCKQYYFAIIWLFVNKLVCYINSIKTAEYTYIY